MYTRQLWTHWGLNKMAKTRWRHIQMQFIKLFFSFSFKCHWLPGLDFFISLFTFCLYLVHISSPKQYLHILRWKPSLGAKLSLSEIIIPKAIVPYMITVDVMRKIAATRIWWRWLTALHKKNLNYGWSSRSLSIWYFLIWSVPKQLFASLLGHFWSSDWATGTWHQAFQSE